jgi:hypothetical protein
VNIADDAGNGFADVEIDTETALLPIQIEIASVAVSGTLSIGEEPFAGVLYFGGERGAERATAESDEEGAYAVVLPRAGSWPVDIRSEEPPIRRRMSSVAVPEPRDSAAVTVDIDLPDSRIYGRVVTPSGAVPDPLPFVYASRGAWENTWRVADEDGRFDFRGLGEGAIDLYAMSSSARSDTRVVRAADGQETEVTLTVREFLKVGGRVVGSSGPLPGANVVVVPASDPVAFFPPATTDAHGRFEALLSAGTQQVHATVSALGHTMTVERSTIVEGGEIVVILEREGGTLRVERPGSTMARGAKTVSLFYRNGVPFGRGEIEKWSSLHPSEPGVDLDPSWITVSALASGRYDVCTVPEPEMSSWLRAGPMRQALCVTVHLSAGREETVALPELPK